MERAIYAATRASSPGNSQQWDFIVVRNPEAKQKIRDLLAPRCKAMRAGVPTTGQSTRRMIAGAIHLAETLNEVPVIIFVCGPVAYPPKAPMEQLVWSALYPGGQKLIVAAPQHGLGAASPTCHLLFKSVRCDLI